MALALLALFLIEPILQLRWNAAWFGCGIALFNQRLPATAAVRARLNLGSLALDLPETGYTRLVFHRFDDGSVGFREGYGFSAYRYFPVMRGLIVEDARRNEVRVLGLCNWNTVALALLVVVFSVIVPRSAPMLLILPVLGLGFHIQKRRFQEVVQAVREQMLDDGLAAQVFEARLRARRPGGGVSDL